MNHKGIKSFTKDNSLYEIHQEVVGFNNLEQDTIYKEGNNQLDIVFAIKEIIRYKSESRLVDYNEIIIIDYCRFIFDLDLRKYFKLHISGYD